MRTRCGGWLRLVGAGLVAVAGGAGVGSGGSALGQVEAPSAGVQSDAGKAAASIIPDTRAGKVMERVIKALADPAAELGEDSFSDAFMQQVPYAKLKEVVQSLHDAHGAFTPVRVEKQDGERGLVLVTKTAGTAQTWEVLLNLSNADKIDGLLLRPAPGADEPPLRDWNDFDERLRDLPGETSFAAYEVRALDDDDKATGKGPKLAEVHSMHPERRLAIGSAFKLYVLGALAEAVQGGTARWDEKLAIKDIYKSLPSGHMQEEQNGAEFPLSRYADLMISISDNTATDHLIHHLGREAVEAYMTRFNARPELNQPFLTTREMFAIKLNSDGTMIERWTTADEKVRRDMVLPDNPRKPTRPAGIGHNPGELAGWVLDTGTRKPWTTPKSIDKVEWFATTEELCRVMADLAQRERQPGMDPLGHALRLNPGLPFDQSRWIKIAYKGGSEPGVLNLTWLLGRADGKVFAVSVGWNNRQAALNEQKMFGLATRAVERLGR